MTFEKLANYFEEIRSTASRNSMTEILARVLKDSDSDEIDMVVYLMLGVLAPSYRQIVFQIANQMMIRAIAQAFDESIDTVHVLYKRHGDLGDVAEILATNHKSGHKKSKVSVTEIYEEFVRVAQAQGEGSQEQKVLLFSEILKKLGPISAKYAVRIPLGKMRLGFSDLTILDALSVMETGDKSRRKIIESAYQVMSDVGVIAKEVKMHGSDKLDHKVTPMVGIPVMPMLAQRLKSADEMIKKMGQVSVEPKFDGLRVLIHYSRAKNTLRAFTRNLHDVSHMFPELMEIGKHIKVDEIILDSEAIGIDATTKKLAEFQVTMQRRRKHDIQGMQDKIPLTFFVFDILFVDGKNLMQSAYTERREMLSNVVTTGSLLRVDDYTLTSDPVVIRQKHDQYIKEGLEGILVKKADSTYVPGRTGWRWVKMKEVEDAHSKLSDTVDAIIMGYTVGEGKRSSFGIGQFLVGVLDKGVIKSVTKVGTGLSDNDFISLKKILKKVTVSAKPTEYEVSKPLTPDFWVSPEVVVEIAADEITKSPNHTSGLALRFPRLIKIRDDKSINQATTLEELIVLAKLQKKSS